MDLSIIIPSMLLILGIGFLLCSTSLYFSQSRFVKQAINTTGIVSGYEYSQSIRSQRDSDTEPGNAGTVTVNHADANIEFMLGTGQRVSVVAKSSTQAQSGESVDILYLPDDPNSMQINEFFPLWGVCIILAGFGAVFCLVALALRFLL